MRVQFLPRVPYVSKSKMIQPRPLEFFKQFVGKKVKYKPWEGYLVKNEFNRLAYEKNLSPTARKAKNLVRIKQVWCDPDKKSCLNGEDVMVAFRYFFPFQRKYEIVVSHSINFEWSLS